MNNKINKNVQKSIIKFKKFHNANLQTTIKMESFPQGINVKILYLLSKRKKEPKWILQSRLQSYQYWKKLKFPLWVNLSINSINYNSIIFYSKPELANLSLETNLSLAQTFTKLGIPFKTTAVALDAVFDSVSLVTTYQNKLAKFGIIFCGFSEAIKKYPNLIKRYLNSVVTTNDNYFAALNSAVFTDGTFCYIPQNTLCPIELSTYFRINAKNSGQFERTLIVAEKNSKIHYFEGCTAIKNSENQLHAAVVELITFENAEIHYSTIQNWYSGNTSGSGGIYNFVTKRGLNLGKNSKIYWTQVESGSAITWKYPSCILLASNTYGEFYSATISTNYQQADTGSKMIHLGSHSKSKIIAKSITSHFANTSYRGLVKIGARAFYARNFSQCDSFLLGSTSTASTYPYLDISNAKSIIEHEAKIAKLNEEQLFYLLQRGISYKDSLFLLLHGFCKDVFVKLPLEFATEAYQLLTLKLN